MAVTNPPAVRIVIEPRLTKKQWKEAGQPNYQAFARYRDGPVVRIALRDVPAWRWLDVPLPAAVAARMADLRYVEVRVNKSRRGGYYVAQLDPARLLAGREVGYAGYTQGGPEGPASAAPAAPLEDDTPMKPNAGPVPVLAPGKSPAQAAAPPPPPAPSGEPSLYIPGTFADPDKPVVRWTPDPVFEAELARLGISYRLVPDYPVAQVDLQASLANTARPMEAGGLDRERVEQIKLSLRTVGTAVWRPLFGAENPAFLPPRPPGTPLVVGGGNHRTNALTEMGVTRAAVYVVDPAVGDGTFRLLAAFHNQGEGEGIPDSQRLELAYREAQEVHRTGQRVKFEEISTRWGVGTRGALSRIFNIRLLQQRLSATGDMPVPNSGRLTEGVLHALVPGVKYNEPLRALARGLAEMTKIPNIAAVKDAVTAMCAQPDARLRTKLVEEWLNKTKATQGRLSRHVTDPKGRTAAAMIGMSLAKLGRLLDHRLPAARNAKDVVTDTAERAELAALLQAAAERLTREAQRLL